MREIECGIETKDICLVLNKLFYWEHLMQQNLLASNL